MEMKSEDIGLERPPLMKYALKNATIEENLCLTNVIQVVEKRHNGGKFLYFKSWLSWFMSAVVGLILCLLEPASRFKRVFLAL